MVWMALKNYSREAVCNGELQRGLLEKLRLHYPMDYEEKGLAVIQLCQMHGS